MNKELTRIGDYCKVRRGASPRPISNPDFFGGDVGWVRIADVTKSNKYLNRTTQYLSALGESRSVRVNRGDLVMSICGTIGRPIIINIPACIHDGFVQLYDFKKESYIEYFYYLLQFHEKGLEAKGQPGTQVNLNSTIVENYRAYIPTLSEQKKIAEILSSVDEVIELTEKEISKLQDLKKGMMQELLTKGIGHAKFKESAVGRIPESWGVTTLVETSVNGIKNGVFNDPKKVGKGYRLINVKDLYREDAIDINTVKLLDLEKKEFDKNKVCWGDIFFTRSSLVLEGIAHSNICLSNREDITYDGHIMKITPNQENFYPPFLEHYFQTSNARRLFMSRAKQSTMTTIGQDDIKDIPVPVPTMDEQKKIAEIIDNLTANILIKKKALTSHNNLKKGLMQNLLTGKVRVKV